MSAEIPKSNVILGCATSAVVAIVLLADGMCDLLSPGLFASEFAATGFSMDMARPLGIIIVICAVLYAIPLTSFLGAILTTGFLGGAICVHFRMGEIFSPPQVVSIGFGVLAWAGLYLRDENIRNLSRMGRTN